MKLRLSDVKYVLEQEIQWCRENPDPEISIEFQVGFIDGLRQAQRILQAAEKSLSDILAMEHFKVKE